MEFLVPYRRSFSGPKFFIAASNLQKNNFTRKKCDNCRSSKIANETCLSVLALNCNILFVDMFDVIFFFLLFTLLLDCNCKLKLFLIHQVALARIQRRGFMIFESSCHLPICLPHTAEASLSPLIAERQAEKL